MKKYTKKVNDDANSQTTNVPLETDVPVDDAITPKTVDETIMQIFNIAKYEFHTLLKKYGGLTFHDAEDVISKSVLKIYQQLQKHDNKNIKALKAYTRKTLNNVALDLIKEKKQRKNTNLDNLAQMSIAEIQNIKYKKIDRALHSDKHTVQEEFAKLITANEEKIYPHLNRTEKRVLEALKTTHNKKQIAAAIGISLRQMSNIFKKITQVIKTVIDIESQKEE